MPHLIAFDLETAAVLPDGVRPDPAADLGITCAALAQADSSRPDDRPAVRTFAQRDDAGMYYPRWTPGYAAHVLDQLEAHALQGDTILTWNGLFFDFQVLAVTSGQALRAAQLATDPTHVDLMFALECALGWPVSLAANAKAQGLTKGTTTVTQGSQAPVMWHQAMQAQEDERVQTAAQIIAEIMSYNVADAKITLAIARHVKREGRFQWIAKSGHPNRWLIPRWEPGAWELAELAVPKCARWPSPNKELVSRTNFYGWTVDLLRQAKKNQEKNGCAVQTAPATPGQ